MSDAIEARVKMWANIVAPQYGIRVQLTDAEWATAVWSAFCGLWWDVADDLMRCANCGESYCSSGDCARFLMSEAE